MRLKRIHVRILLGHRPSSDLEGHDDSPSTRCRAGSLHSPDGRGLGSKVADPSSAFGSRPFGFFGSSIVEANGGGCKFAYGNTLRQRRRLHSRLYGEQQLFPGRSHYPWYGGFRLQATGRLHRLEMYCQNSPITRAETAVAHAGQWRCSSISVESVIYFRLL
jgi:hypothetical protein